MSFNVPANEFADLGIFDAKLTTGEPVLPQWVNAKVIDLETGKPVPFDGVNLIEGKPLNITDEERAKLPPLDASVTGYAYADGEASSDILTRFPWSSGDIDMALASETEILEFFEQLDLTDPLGREVTRNADFRALVQRATQTEYFVATLESTAPGAGHGLAYNGFLPVGDRFAVRVMSESERKTDSGIILPQSAAEKPYEVAEVVAVGPGKLTDAGLRLPLEIAVGDWVSYRKHAGCELDYQGEKLKVLQEKELLAIHEQP